MKAKELREKSVEELNAELLNLLREQFNLRMQAASGQLQQTHLLKLLAMRHKVFTPLAVPWNLPYSLERYVARRDAVSASCRLSASTTELRKTMSLTITRITIRRCPLRVPG